MSIPFLLYLISCIRLVITENADVLNFTYADDVRNSISVFNSRKGQNTTDSLTVCTWAKPAGENVDFLSIQDDYYDRYDGATFVFGNIDYRTNQIFASVNYRSFESNELCLPNNTWIHICLRYRAQEGEIFYYGSPTSVQYTDDPTNYTDILLKAVIGIGSFLYNYRSRAQYVGQLYNFNIWKKSLSDNDIKKLAKCSSPEMEGDLLAWSKLVNGVKNGDKDIQANPERVTVLMDERPCPNPKLPDCLEDGGGNQSANSNPGTSSEEMSSPGSNLDETGNSDPGTSARGMTDPGSSLDQTGNSDPGTSSRGMTDTGSSLDQTGNSDPGTSSRGMTEPGSILGQTGNSDPGTSSRGMIDPGSSLGQTGNSDPGTSSGEMSDPGSSLD